MRVGLGAAAAYAAITLCAGAALADFDDRPPSEPRVRPTLFWALTQLVPSPEGVVLEDTATSREVGDFGVRWQVTPLLYAWDMHFAACPRGARSSSSRASAPRARSSCICRRSS